MRRPVTFLEGENGVTIHSPMPSFAMKHWHPLRMGTSLRDQHRKAVIRLHKQEWVEGGPGVSSRCGADVCAANTELAGPRNLAQAKSPDPV